MFKFSNNSLRNRKGVDPRLIEISDLAISITAVDFGIPATGGVRTNEQQNELYLAGKSQLDGYDRRSNHQDGKALDFFAFVDGAASWHPAHLSMVACAFLQSASQLGYRVKWGGHWRPFKSTDGLVHGWDMPHIEMDD